MKNILNKVKRRFRRIPLTLQEKYVQYEIGRATYGDLKVKTWGEGATLKIGAFCSIASGVKIFLGGEHRTDWVSTFPFSVLWKDVAGHIPGHPMSRGDVVVGNDVWIGTEAIILSGVHIGNGAVIGARAVVTRDVPPYAVVSGNPAQIVRTRFSPEIVARLEAVAWWNWDDERIKQHLPKLLSGELEQFLQAAEREDGAAAQ